jgi:hypothetical protein
MEPALKVAVGMSVINHIIIKHFVTKVGILTDM